MKPPFTIHYENDTGADDDSFWQWWEIRDGANEGVCRCQDEATAEVIRNMLDEHHNAVFIIRDILQSLPSNLDWLNPDTERAARALVKLPRIAP